MADKSSARKTARKTSGAASSSKRTAGSSAGSGAKRTAKPRASGSSAAPRRASPGRTGEGRNGFGAADAVARARESLAQLLGRPVEAVLGIDRDGGGWVATVQVVELQRIPSTTDVLGEYETVLDRHGEMVRYHRTRRYHRGQVDEGGR
jgi:hypothetical protein